MESIRRPSLGRLSIATRRRALASLGGGLVLAGVGRSQAAGHEATPEECVRCAPRIGEPVFVAGADGQAIREIVVEEFIEPFTENDACFAPQRGAHFAALRVTFRATGQQPMNLNAAAFYLQYADHFIVGPTAIRRDPQVAVPDLHNTAVEAGKSKTGSVGFTVLNGVEIVRVFHYLQGDRIFLTAELC